jgi:hypothetical protein
VTGPGTDSAGMGLCCKDRSFTKACKEESQPRRITKGWIQCPEKILGREAQEFSVISPRWLLFAFFSCKKILKQTKILNLKKLLDLET